jgi:predicted nucleic acid-binding protein
MVSPQATVEVPGISPADAAYLAAAVVGHADYLVTGDRGLLALRQFQGTRIVSAVEFLVELQLEGRV